MKKKLVSSSLAVITALAASVLSLAASVPSEGLSFDLPAGFVEVPASTIDRATNAMHERAPHAKVTRPLAAFQRPPIRPDGLTYPYILVYATDSRSPTTGEMKALAAHAPAQQSVDSTAASSDGLISGGTPSLSYDEATHRVKLALMTNVNGSDSMPVYTEFVPTSKGIVSLNGYLSAASATAARQYFEPGFATARLDATHAYTPIEGNPRPTGSFDWSKVITAALLGALLAVVFGRKKKPA